MNLEDRVSDSYLRCMYLHTSEVGIEVLMLLDYYLWTDGRRLSGIEGSCNT